MHDQESRYYTINEFQFRPEQAGKKNSKGFCQCVGSPNMCVSENQLTHNKAHSVKCLMDEVRYWLFGFLLLPIKTKLCKIKRMKNTKKSVGVVFCALLSNA